MAQSDLGPGKWLYAPMKYSLPVLRGEACLAFYDLVFLGEGGRDHPITGNTKDGMMPMMQTVNG